MARKDKSEETPATVDPASTDPTLATVKLTVEVPATLVVPAISKRAGSTGVSIPVGALAENPAAVKHVFMYGVGRFTRDGLDGGLPEAVRIDGTPAQDDDKPEALRALTDAETDAAAVVWSTAKWDRLLAGKLRERVTGGDPVLGELRVITIGYLRKQGVKLDAIGKLADRAACEKALAPYAGIFDKAVARAAAIAEAKSAEL